MRQRNKESGFDPYGFVIIRVCVGISLATHHTRATITLNSKTFQLRWNVLLDDHSFLHGRQNTLFSANPQYVRYTNTRSTNFFYSSFMANSIKKQNVNRNIVGKRVREARTLDKHPLTQDQLSGKLAIKGVVLDRVAIAKIESGLRCVFDFEVRALASVLKVDIRWLLGIEERAIKDESNALGLGKSRL